MEDRPVRRRDRRARSGPLLNETSPIFTLLWDASANASSPLCAAPSRDGLTSAARIEPERRRAARASRAAPVRDDARRGRASAAEAAASASRNSTSGTQPPRAAASARPSEQLEVRERDGVARAAPVEPHGQREHDRHDRSASSRYGDEKLTARTPRRPGRRRGRRSTAGRSPRRDDDLLADDDPRRVHGLAFARLGGFFVRNAIALHDRRAPPPAGTPTFPNRVRPGPITTIRERSSSAGPAGVTPAEPRRSSDRRRPGSARIRAAAGTPATCFEIDTAPNSA